MSIIILGISSCEHSLVNEEVSENIAAVSKSVTNVEGVLHFDNLESVDSTLTIIGKMNSAEYKSWANKMHFSSMFSEYEKLSSSKSSINSLTQSSVAYFDKDTESYRLNNVNSNYAKITSPLGIIFIGNASYQFSATEIKYIKGVSKIKVNNLLTSRDSEYKSKGIIKTEVQEIGKSDLNARMGPWNKEQQGNNITNIEPGSNNPNYLKSKLVSRYYYIVTDPNSPIGQISKMSLEVEGNFYHQGVFGEQKKTPQQYSLNWTFQVATGLQMSSYTTYSSSYHESGIQTIFKVLYDGNAYDIKNLNIPVSALAFNQSGSVVTSMTTFVLTN